MVRKIVLIVLLFCAVASTAAAEDPRERQFFTPALNPKHKDKPKVSGWAKQRIEEKINRGMLAMPNKEGKVYLSWRLLKSDAKGTAFNVYRSVVRKDSIGEGAEAVKLNAEPVVATTDFIDEQPALGRESTYWIKPVLAGKELGPSEKALLKANAGDKAYYSSIKFQGPYRPQRLTVADILGDWREELITVLPGELRIYTTTIPAKDRRICLMQNPTYRAEVAHRSMGYEQSPVTGYYLGVSVADSAKASSEGNRG